MPRLSFLLEKNGKPNFFESLEIDRHETEMLGYTDSNYNTVEPYADYHLRITDGSIPENLQHTDSYDILDHVAETRPDLFFNAEVMRQEQVLGIFQHLQDYSGYKPESPEETETALQGIGQSISRQLDYPESKGTLKRWKFLEKVTVVYSPSEKELTQEFPQANKFV